MNHITHISAINFMTFNKISLDLEGKCYIVKGENLDDEGQSSNGSGKSSLLDIIAVTLLGESLSGRDLKNCVNWLGGESYFETSLILSNNIKISRRVYSNTRASELYITINDKTPDNILTKGTGVDVRDGNRYILDKILGISKEDLLNYFLISGDAYQSFFSANNSKKMEIISRFSKAQRVDEIVGKLGGDIKLFNNELLVCNSQISNLEGQLTSLRSLIDERAVIEFENKKRREVGDVLAKIERLELNKTLLFSKPVPDSIDVELMQKEVNEIGQSISKVTADRLDLQVKVSKLKTFLAGGIQCPKCKNEFTTEDPSVDLKLARRDLEDYEKQILQLKSDEGELNVVCREIKQMIEESEKQNRERSKIIHENEIIEQQLSAIEIQIEREEQSLVEIDSRIFDDGGIKRKIEEIQEKKSEVESKHATIGIQTALHSTWLDRFKEFKFYLANKPVEIITHYTNDFLNKLGSDLSITIEGFKVLKSGELKAELTPVVYRNMINPQSYNSFSGGEKVRLNLAADLSLQRLINENSSVGFEFYASDEAVNSIDSLGLQQAAKAFNGLNQTILLVTHSGENIVYDNTLTVRKQNSKSEIV